jgi:hypothetical protein
MWVPGFRLGTHGPLGQSVEYCYKSIRRCTKVVFFLKSSHKGHSEKKIKWVKIKYP